MLRLDEETKRICDIDKAVEPYALTLVAALLGYFLYKGYTVAFVIAGCIVALCVLLVTFLLIMSMFKPKRA